jgi:hypothetical protein
MVRPVARSVHRRQGRAVHADLDETGADAGPVDAGASLFRPARGELFGGLGVGVGRQVIATAGAVIAGVGEQAQPRRFGEAEEELRVAAEVGWRALDEGPEAELAQAAQVRQGNPDHFVGIEPRAGGDRGAGEVHQDVLVDEGPAEVARLDGPGDRMYAHPLLGGSTEKESG